MKKTVSLSLKFAILAALAYYIFHDIDISLLTPALKNYSLLWLFITVLSVIFSDLILALRWRSLSQNSCSLKASFESIVFSVLTNTILPAKLGEVAKLFYLQKLYKIKLSHGFSLMLTERFFDVLVLGILVVLSAQIYWQDKTVQIFGWLVITFIIILFFLIKSPLSREMIHFFPTKFFRRWLIRLYHHFQIVLAKESVMILTFWSIILWMSYIVTTMIFFHFVMGLSLNTTELFIATMVSFIAFSIPLLPAGSGTFQAGIIFILTQYGVAKEEALVGSIILQLIMVLPSSIISIIILQKKSLSLKELIRS